MKQFRSVLIVSWLILVGWSAVSLSSVKPDCSSDELQLHTTLDRGIEGLPSDLIQRSSGGITLASAKDAAFDLCHVSAAVAPGLLEGASLMGFPHPAGHGDPNYGLIMMFPFHTFW